MPEISAPWLFGDQAGTTAYLIHDANRYAPDSAAGRAAFIRLAGLTMIQTLHGDTAPNLTDEQRSQYTLAVIAACQAAVKGGERRD